MKKVILIFVIMLLTFSIANAEWVVEEGFEGTFPPTGWTLESASAKNWVQDNCVLHGPGSAYAGTYAAMYNNYSYSSGSSGSMTTTTFDVSTLTSPQLDFYWWNDDYASNPAKLVLYTSNDGATFTPIDTLDVCQSGGWVNYNVALDAAVTHIKLTGISDYGIQNTFIDNFKVGQPAPYDVAVNQLTPNAAIIEGESFNYFIEIVNAGLNNDTYDLTATGGTWTYEIRDNNDVGVISSIAINAGEADTVILKVTAPASKDITDVETFTATSQADPTVFDSIDVTTTAYAPLANLFEDFEGCVSPDLPEKWSKIVESTSNSAHVKSYSSATYAHSGTQMAKMYNYNDTAAELLLITPALDSGTLGGKLKFWARSGSTQNLIIGTITDPTDPTTFVPIETFEVTTTYQQFGYDVNLAKGTGYVAWKHALDGTFDSDYIDDVEWFQTLPYNVALNQLTPDGVIIEGNSYNYFMQISNNGINDDTYDLTVTGGAWAYEIKDKDDLGVISFIDITAGASDTVIVKVTAPSTKDISDMVTFTATSQGDPLIFACDDITTSAYIPYLTLFENFDACVAPALPPKWTAIVQTTSTYPYVYTYSSATYAYSGLISVKMYNSSDSVAELLLVTPALQTGVWGNIITAMVRSSSGNQDILVGTMTDPNDPSTFSLVQSFPVTGTYTEIACQIDFAKSSGYVAFKHANNGTYDYYYIDDVAWVEIIPEPYMVIDETEHDFGMVDQGTVDTWDVTIYNDGYGTLYFNGATVNPPFSVTYPDSIEPLCNDIATVTLDATTIGMYLDVLEFHTNAIQDSTIDLSVIVKGADYVMEGFEALEFPPFGWSNPDNYWRRFTNNAYEGDGYARVSWYHEDDAILYSPHLIIETGDIISFYWINANLYDGKDGKVNDADITYFEISNDGTNWEVLATLNPDEVMTEYEFVCVAVPDDYIGINAEVRWRHVTENTGESRGVGLDNVMLPPPYLAVNFALDPYSQSDYNSIGETVAYDIDVYNTGIQADRYYISLVGSKIRGKDVEDFESDDGGYVGTGLWQWGSPTSGPGNAHSGVNVWATNLSGDYEASSNYTLDSPEITIGSDDPTLSFWHWYDTEASFDGGNVKISTDGGATWIVIEPVGGYPGTSNSSNPLYPEPIFCGHDQGLWEQVTFDLSTYAGQTASFRWHLGSDGSVQYPGWYIDDVDITSGGSPPPPPSGWPVTFSDPYLDINPGEMGTFTASVEIPDDGSVIEDDVNTSTIYVESREDPLINHEADVVTTAHPKDPYEPNDLMVDATPAHFDFVSEGAQIYYNADYRDKDLDIYTIDCLEGDIVWCAFELPVDETQFDGAIKLVDADSTELAWVDSWVGGGSEYLQYRILEDGDYYWILGKWNNVLEGKASKKDVIRDVNTTYYVVTFDLIPSPEVDVEPPELTLGMIAGTGGTVSDELYISNIAPDALAENLNWDIQIQIPGVETLYESDFGDGADWTVTGGTNWGINNSSYAGGTPPEARFNWSPSTTALQRIISPVINTAGYTSANLTFKHYVNDYAGGYTIGVATTSDGGTTWNTVWSTIPTGSIGPETFAVTVDNADMGSDQFQLCWFFDGISFDINYWYVDDVYLGVGSSWIDVSPVAGSIGQGNTQTVTVTCDGDARLDPGVYNADLIVHNDALLYGVSDITVPVTFYISDEAGGLQGTVTFNGEPLDSVMVKVGNFVTYTDEYGYYEFDAIASGFFNILFYKEGFAPYWAYDVYLNPGWTVLLDAELIFDGPVPENLSATGIQEAVDIDWDKPQTGGGGGGTQVDYVLDDGTYENGWAINPAYEAWLGNQFPTTDGGEIVSFELYGDANAAAGGESVTIDVYDSDRNLVGTTDPFVIPADDWVTVPAPNIPFTGDFYAMVHWDMLTGNTNYIGFDENGPNANAGYDWYLSAGTWTLIHVAAASTPGVFGIRATAMVRGKNIELAYDTYQLGKEPEVNFRQVDNSAFDKGQRVLNKVFAQSGHTVDSGNYEVSHYTFNGDTELGFRMPRDITLLGYKVYELTKGLVADVVGPNNTFFTDDIVAVGTEYTYWVTAVYDAGESGESNTDTAIPLPPGGGIYHEPFDLNWTTTGWTTAGSPNNWTWAAGYAYLYWSPSVVNYDMSLISPDILLPDNPLDIYALTVSMYVDNYSTGDGEVWEIWVIHDGGETLLWSYDDPTANWGVTGGTDWIYNDLDVYAGQEIQLKFRSHGATTFNFNNWYVYDVLIDGAMPPPDYGALEGIVTDGDGIPLEGVAVTANPSDYNPVYTDDLGFYLIDPMATGFYDVQYYKDGYTEIWYYDVEIDSGVTTVLDVALGNPTMDITPTSIPDATVPVGGTSIRTITVTNNGNAPLDWGASLENLTDTQYTINYDLQTNPPTPENSEMAPLGSGTYEGDISEDTWDILFNFNATAASMVGIETDGVNIYTTTWNAGNFSRYDMTGTPLGDFTIGGVSAIRDMAYDGTYFYGSPATMSIYKMDLANEQLIGTIPVSCSGVTGVRHIAYDPELDGGNGGFWVGNWDELGAITMTGSQIYSASSVTSVYGSAYDQYTDGGPYLWLFAQPASNAIMQQFDIATQSLTGVTHDCSDAPGFNAGISGGAATYCADGKLILLADIQQDPNLIVAYELAPFATWITIDPTSGTVLPYGGFEEVTVTFDACDDPAGTIHTCDIVFESAQGVPSVTVPVTLMVGNPEYGDLTGTVTAATGGVLIEGAEITANAYVTYTNALGVYTIEDMLVGYYTVECTADGYNYQVAVDVPILLNQTTTQDFALTAPIMTVNPLVINTSVDPATPIQVDITIDNDGDGPLEWDAMIIIPSQNPISLPPASPDYPRGTDPISLLKDTDPTGTPSASNPIQFRGSTAWGVDATANELVSFDVDVPASFTTLGSITAGSFFAGDFLEGVNDFITTVCYETNLFGTLDVSNGSFSQTGTLPPTGAQIWSDFSRDPTDGTLYGIQTDVYQSNLYVIDPDNVTATLIGPIGFDGIIATAIDGAGNMWGVDIALDVLVSIDKTTGAGTQVGLLGYDANYAQGATWDPASGNVLLAAYGTSGELRIADTSTGNTTVVGPLGPLGHEVTVLAIPGDVTQPWITIDPTFEVVPAGGTSTLCVFLNTVDYSIGEILYANIEIISDPDVGTVIIPVTVLVSDTVSNGEIPVTETSLYANFPNPMLHSTTFNFSLRERSHVKLSVYNVKGQLVDIILDEDLDPCAEHPVVWNGTANGKKLANGIYFYRLETDNKTFLKKMILMK